MSDFDYHRAMREVVADAPDADPARMAWIMSSWHLVRYRKFVLETLGGDEDANECFGIPIEIGDPPNGVPFELRVRPLN